MRFVLIDRLVRIVPGRLAVARRRFDAGDPIFADHFPGFPVVPGTLLTEAMAQTGGWLLHATYDRAVKTYLTIIERAKFRGWVRPDDELVIEAQLLRGDRSAALADASVSVGARVVATARLTYGLTSLREPSRDLASPATRAWAEATFRALGGPEALAVHVSEAAR